MKSFAISASVGVLISFASYAAPPIQHYRIEMTDPGAQMGNITAWVPDPVIAGLSVPPHGGSSADPLYVSNAPAGGSAAPASTLSYTNSDTTSAATTSGQLFAAGAWPHIVTYCTLPASTNNVWLNVTGGAAVVNSGPKVPAAGGCVTFGTTAMPMPTSSVTAITDASAAQTVTRYGG